MYAVGEREVLTRSGIRAGREDPNRWLKAGNGARHHAATCRHEQQVARHCVQCVLDQGRHPIAAPGRRFLLRQFALSGKAPGRPMCFGERGDFRQHRDCFLRKFSHRRFAGEHDAIGAIENCVRHISCLGAAGQTAGNHRFEHLRRSDDGFTRKVRFRNKLLLSVRDLFDRHLNTEIAARNHDTISRCQNFVEVRERVGSLDLCNNERLSADFCRCLAHSLDVRGAFNK